MAKLEPKTPLEVRNFGIDWSVFLGEDTIASSTVEAVGVDIDDDDFDTDSVTITISGGEESTLARITNTIVTTAGMTESEVYTIWISSQGEPVNVSELKEHLALWEDNTRDALIAGYGRAAREYFEKYTKLILLRRQFTEQFTNWDDIKIFNRPLVSIDTVTYTAADGTTEEYEGEFFWIDGYPASNVSAVVVATLPTLHASGIITVTYTAGLPEGEAPESAIQAIKMLVSHWFDNRPGMFSDKMEEAPHAVQSLMNIHARQVAQ